MCPWHPDVTLTCEAVGVAMAYTRPYGVPWLFQAAAVPGARLHADTPRGPPLLTGLNPTVDWCTNQPSPGGTEWEVDGWDIIF